MGRTGGDDDGDDGSGGWGGTKDDNVCRRRPSVSSKHYMCCRVWRHVGAVAAGRGKGAQGGEKRHRCVEVEDGGETLVVGQMVEKID